jgi:ABC-type dipeptide/oligopeptide/nickel transport system ATPase subunit
MDAAEALADLIAVIDRANVVDVKALDRIKSSPELAVARSLLAGAR